MEKRIKCIFSANYNGDTIKPDEVMVPFPYDELDARENCVNKECVRAITVGGKRFRVLYKAVSASWAKQAVSALSLIENEELGHYVPRKSVSRDAMQDEYELELGTAKSVEDEIMEQMELDESLQTFKDLVSSLIEEIPKLGLAVLLLHTGVRGEEFYSQMLLTREPANRIRQQAEGILKNGLANFDISAINCYRCKNDNLYKKRAYLLLDEIMRRYQ